MSNVWFEQQLKEAKDTITNLEAKLASEESGETPAKKAKKNNDEERDVFGSVNLKAAE